MDSYSRGCIRAFAFGALSACCAAAIDCAGICTLSDDPVGVMYSDAPLLSPLAPQSAAARKPPLLALCIVQILSRLCITQPFEILKSQLQAINNKQTLHYATSKPGNRRAKRAGNFPVCFYNTIKRNRKSEITIIINQH